MVDIEVKPYSGDGITLPGYESKFWSSPQKWPRDPAGYVFLARAVHILGRQKFGAEWVGDEPATPIPQPFEKYLKDDASTVNRVFHILETHGGERYQALKSKAPETLKSINPSPSSDVPAPSLSASPRLKRILPLSAPRKPELSAEHYALLKEIIEPRRDEMLMKAQRVAQLRHIIERSCEAGHLRAAVRPAKGGNMQPLDRAVWNTERTYTRWTECQINPKDPYSLGVAGEDHCWIFLVKEDLERFIAPPTPKEPPMQAPGFNDIHLSPYLRLMLEVVRDLKITPENQGTHVSLAAEFKARWKRTPSLSNNDADSMATLIREPESKGGRAKK